MAPLTELGKGTMTFDAGPLTITIRTLSPEEEITIQRYARDALAEGESTDQTTALDFLDRFRNMTLAYSIMQVGNLNFNGVDHVETGETLPNGVAIRIPKHMAVLRVVNKWSREMSVSVMRKFERLNNQIEKELSKAIVFDESDLDAEIARLEEKLADLKDQKMRADLGTSDPRSEMRERVAASTATKLAPPKPSPSTMETQQAEPELVVNPKATFVEPISDQPKTLEVEPTAPVEPRRSVLGSVTPQPVIAPPVRQATPQTHLSANDPLWDVESSFEDANDPQVMEAALRREHQRTTPQAPIGPHLSAREAHEEVQRSMVKEGSIDGVDVYVAPPQEITARAPQPVIRPPAQGTINPRFRPPAR